MGNLFGDGIDTSAQDQLIADQQKERGEKLTQLQEQRFAIIKSQGEPIWNELSKDRSELP